MVDATINAYTAGKTALQHPTVYECTPITIQPDDAAITVDGDNKTLKAGIIYPSNDATAKGVVLQDYDVTDTPINVALAYAGAINTAKLPEAPSAEAKAALPRITFFTK